VSASEARDAPPRAPGCLVACGAVTIRELRRDDLERVVALYLDVMVRHEALLVRAGCETPPLGCHSSLVKLRAA
jgi:hypothetical protein